MTSLRPERGFALVVTLSLMILLTMVVVGLLSLSSVALRTSSQGQAASEARANARLALMMAIGELQRELGPDSRISAPHDVGQAATGGKPRWTAVYDAWQVPDDANTPETPQSRNPKFRSWLVSGANQATGGPAGVDEEPLVTLQKSLPEGATAADEIRVPMHAVSSGSQRGRIAWWTADESVKAKINAGSDGSLASSPLLDSQSPRHVGHKAVPVLNNFDWKPGQRSIAMSNGVVNLAAGIGNRGLGNVNHDITVHSAGVLADVRAGRLKRDLSILLSRPVTELQNKPLYLANGRMNRFEITEEGVISNTPGLPANASGANRWGINLEELHLFHQLHREVDWSTGKPRLMVKNSKEAIAQDRFHIYRKPTIEALNLMLSFIASAEGSGSTYRIDGMLDAMIATSNPNDIPLVWPPSVILRMEMHSLPYRVDWDIRKANNTPRVTHVTSPLDAPFFQASIRNGFTLEPGEAAVFGSSLADKQSRSCNLTRGYAPRGGVRISETEWGSTNNTAPKGLRATGLASDDKVGFSMIPAPGNYGAAGSGWILCPVEVRNSSGTGDLSVGWFKLDGGGNPVSVLTTAPINKYMLSPIKMSQRPTVEEFIGNPMPVMMVTLMPNVEKSRDDLLPPNAFASRPYHLHEPAIARMDTTTATAQDTERTMQTSQMLVMAEPMDYDFGSARTMPSGEGGRNLYHGGGRAAELGGSFNVVKRRIPLAPPLSLGAFENAIACGLVQRFAAPGTALNGNANGLPAMAKTIGNSWSNPFLASNSVTSGAYHDPSWMANTALWDSWFLSGIVDGQGAGSNPFLNDRRSPRAQFRELAEGTGALRNKRFAYNGSKSLEAAFDELFDGEFFKPSAINKLSTYLLVDGAFNVNSTSVAAWKAFLTSVREQELLNPEGSAQETEHPFGTLGYAASKVPSDPEGDWSGFRDLTDAQMEELATKIVEQVKERGPFLSMADFVNRRPNGADDTHKALGALQAAINKSGINERYAEDERKLTEDDVPAMAGKSNLNNETVPARAIGSAGFLSQAALLSSFGSQIAVRGDTFVIRTYGDSRDSSGKILAKAWCEAVVQRFPEYVDVTNSPEIFDNLIQTNTTFGRKFGIVSFRWLDSKEI